MVIRVTFYVLFLSQSKQKARTETRIKRMRMKFRILFVLVMLLGSTQAVDFYRTRRHLSEEIAVTLTEAEAVALKPAFHITGTRGWINDPGGMFEYNGFLHVFPQANPRSNTWQAPYWGHVVSKDKVHYQRLENACANDTSYDSGGCWTGSCFPDEDGVPVCWYTAASGLAELGYYKQQVAALRPVNASDPLLRNWTKPAGNPLAISVPPGVSWAQFRDPHGPWQEDGSWFTAIGGAFDCAGAQLLYSTPSLRNATFTYQGIIADQVSIDQVGTCPLETNKTADGFRCDQFGSVCRVWECTDIFTLEDDNITVLKWSDQDDNRVPFARDWYLLSDVTPSFSQQTLAANNESMVGDSLLETELGGQNSQPRQLEFGDIYASKSWEDTDGRRLMLGWAFETAAGCTQQCSAGSPFTDSLGFQGSHHLIREVTYDAETQTLKQYPIEEYSNLKEGDSLFDDDVILNASSPVVRVFTGNEVLQSDLQVEFEISSNSSGPRDFRIGAMINFNGPSHVAAYINGTVTGPNVTAAWVWIDRTNMTDTMTNATAAGQQIPLPPQGLPADDIDFRLITDRSHLEVYAFEGLALGTIKVYPNNTAAGNWTMSLMSSSAPELRIMADVELDHWHQCWVTDATSDEPLLVSSAKSDSVLDSPASG